MKFIIKIFIVFFFVTQVSFSEIDLGLYVGGNSFSFSGEPPIDADYAGEFGLTAALTADFFLTQHFVISLQPGIVQCGSRIVYPNRFNDNVIDSTFYIRQNCLNVPLNFKIFTPKRYFYFLGGMNFNYFFSNYANKYRGEKKDISQYLKEYDISMNFGVAYQYFFPRFTFFIELRYTHGYQNINTTNVVDRYKTPIYISNFKLTGTSLLLGLSYRLY